MARGWESKSVESQQGDEAAEQAKPKNDAEDGERRAKRESLQLSRQRVVHDLETARTPVHRTALENALAFLDGELAKL